MIKLTALLITLVVLLSAQPDRFGNPACPGADQEFADRSFFALCHNSSLKVPLWVGYELKPEHLHRRAARPSHFRHDSELAGTSAHNADYKYSGFSRGHMAPATDFAWSDEAIRSTFVLSNAVPQHQSVNAGVWTRLEMAARRIAADSEAVYVFTGPIFESADTEFIGQGKVAVPSHTYKVILALQGDRRAMYAAIVPNTADVKGPLDRFATSVDEVEHRTGLDFFAALEDSEERRLESSLESLP